MNGEDWKRGRTFRKGRDLDVDWAYRVERELFRRLDMEQLRHLVERLCTLLTPDQRELLLARVQLIHTNPEPDLSVMLYFHWAKAQKAMNKGTRTASGAT